MRLKAGRIRCTLFWSAVIVWSVFMAAALTGRVVPKIVLSGSMEPEIHTGSLVLIHQSVPPEKIKEQDIISYQIGEDTQIMHRVIDINEQERKFSTKGDANKYADPSEVGFDQYRGKEIVSIPYAGYLAGFVQSAGTVRILIFICAAVMIFNFILEKGRREHDKKV